MSTMTKSPVKRQTSREDIVRNYLKEIGRTPLLSQEEEISLGRQVQVMQNLSTLRQEMAQELGSDPTLEQWAKAAGLSCAKLQNQLSQGISAKDHMIQANLRLVVNVATKYQNRGLELLDMIQEGTIGLERAVEKFDPSKGYRFSTYGYWWIRQGITRAIAEKGRTIRLPIHIIEKLNKIKKAQRQLAQELGRTATINELATKTDLNPLQVRHLIKLNQQPASLDLQVGEARDITFGELLENPVISPQEYVERREEIANLHSIIKELSEKQQRVLVLRFGLEGEEEHSLAKVGDCMGVSRERARQLEAAALKRLRKEFAANSKKAMILGNRA